MNKLIYVILMMVFIGCSGGRNSTGYSIINDMIYPVPYEAYSVNPNYFDGQSNQLPVKGAIARGFMPHPMDSEGNPQVLETPYDMNEYAWGRGKMLFTATCAACHGGDGKGKTEVIKRGFPKPPNFYKGRKFKYSKKRKYPAGRIFNIITFGYGNMPSHSQQLYVEDRWFVAEYVRERLMVKGKK